MASPQEIEAYTVNLIVAHGFGLNPKPGNSANRRKRGVLKSAIRRHLDAGRPGFTAMAARLLEEYPPPDLGRR